MIVTVKNCARCQSDHKDLVFEELANASDEWNYVAICPNVLQPILMRIVPDEEQKTPNG